MRRREVIALLGSAVVAALAQSGQKKKLIGLISAFSDKEMLPLFEAFRTRMQELGWIEGQDIILDVRSTSGDYAKLDAEASSFVSASADVICCQWNPASPPQDGIPEPHQWCSPTLRIQSANV